MERNLEQEIDELKAQVSRLVETTGQVADRSEGVSAEGRERALRLRERARSSGSKGAVEYYGAYDSGSRGYLRTQEYLPVEELLELDLEHTAKILFALGNSQRLAMLLAILEAPRTAAELVELLALGTSGQAYHHLKALQAADFVTQEPGGRYALRPHRVHAFLMLLAEAYDVLDRKYTSADIDGLEGSRLDRAGTEVTGGAQ